MPKATSTKKEITQTKTVKTVSNDAESTLKALKDAQKTIKELEAKMAQLSSLQSVAKNIDEVDYGINPNKKTRITSLTYGVLTLYAPNRGFLRFNNFGDFHTVTYAQLMDYINTCRTEAQEGKFYIHNAEMVEDLGLGEAYDKIIDAKLLNEILQNNNYDSYDVLSNIPESQKESIGKLIADKIYNREVTDLNQIDELSKRLGIDLRKKADEKKTTEEFINR